MEENVHVLYEDKTLLVLHKPADLVVNISVTQKERTLQHFLQDYFSLSDQGIGGRAGIVHRLDKETSGILVVAKTQKAFENLQEQFQKRTVVKKYLALVHGVMAQEKGSIHEPLARNPFNRTKYGVFAGGRDALTEYAVKERFPSFTLLQVTPKTGRTHQIRVHLKYIGFSVVGDEVYAGRKTARDDRRWCPRQFLHAFFLEITHPETGKRMHFEDPLPTDLQQALATLQNKK
ncbi:MAG TPA: RluA family pseudouridine synthase [Patescibacteria group bacterium]|nr:RluA family pseudouridine synthase [Patescibacteria group bacterium]